MKSRHARYENGGGRGRGRGRKSAAGGECGERMESGSKIESSVYDLSLSVSMRYLLRSNVASWSRANDVVSRGPSSLSHE